MPHLTGEAVGEKEDNEMPNNVKLCSSDGIEYAVATEVAAQMTNLHKPGVVTIVSVPGLAKELLRRINGVNSRTLGIVVTFIEEHTNLKKKRNKDDNDNTYYREFFKSLRKEDRDAVRAAAQTLGISGLVDAFEKEEKREFIVSPKRD